MMTGEYADSDEIFVPLTLRGADGHEEQVNAVIDTGFTGFLVLPTPLMQTLGFPQMDFAEVILGDNSVTELALHEVNVLWHGGERTVLAYASEGDALLGMSLLRGSIGTIQFFPGGVSQIEPRP